MKKYIVVTGGNIKELEENVTKHLNKYYSDLQVVGGIQILHNSMYAQSIVIEEYTPGDY